MKILEILFIFRRAGSAGPTFSNDHNEVKLRHCVPCGQSVHSIVIRSPHLSHYFPWPVLVAYLPGWPCEHFILWSLLEVLESNYS